MRKTFNILSCAIGAAIAAPSGLAYAVIKNCSDLSYLDRCPDATSTSATNPLVLATIIGAGLFMIGLKGWKHETSDTKPQSPFGPPRP